MRAYPSSLLSILMRGFGFAVTSALAVCFPLALGGTLWPERLSGGAEFIFWLASGVNTAGLLILGWRYWPAIFGGILPAWLFYGQSLKHCLLGAGGNVFEAFLAFWILHRLGRIGETGDFSRTRTVLALLVAAAVAPIAASLLVPTYLVFEGHFSTAEFWSAVGNWNLANGCAILSLTPLLLAVRSGKWISLQRPVEAAGWIIGGLLCGAIAFDAVFVAKGLNFAFLIFPFVIFCAVRFGPSETSAALLIAMISIYGSLVRHATLMTPASAPATLWFVQAFFWILSATGLIVAALVAERRSAEQRTLDEQGRTLEASLREERARLDALRYQINPHFLFNSLNSLRSTLPLDAEVPREMVTELADYLRSTLKHGDDYLAPLWQEMESIRNYLAVEKARFGDALQSDLSIATDASDRLVPVFLLQPLVENAIKHGLEASQAPFCLKVDARLTADSKLLIEVANTGQWKTKGSGTGLGLANVQSRLKLLYNESATLEQNTDGQWVRFRITLPA